MKRIGLMALALIALAGVAFGEMDDKLYNLTVVSNASTTGSYVLRGTLRAVHIDVTAPATSTVAVTSEDGRTLFSKAGIAADAVYLPVAALHTTAGAAATFNSNWSTNDGVTSTEAQAWYGAQPMAEKITVTLTGQNTAIVTNNTKVRLVYDK
jgi:hypothetical protein